MKVLLLLLLELFIPAVYSSQTFPVMRINQFIRSGPHMVEVSLRDSLHLTKNGKTQIGCCCQSRNVAHFHAALANMIKWGRPAIIVFIAYTAVLSFLFPLLSFESSPTKTNITPCDSLLTFVPPPPIPLSGKKLKMLFFTHGYNWETGMDRFFFIHYYALK